MTWIHSTDLSWISKKKKLLTFVFVLEMMRLKLILILNFNLLVTVSGNLVTDLPSVSSPSTTKLHPVPLQHHLNYQSLDPQKLNSINSTFIPIEADQDPCRPLTLSPALWSDLDLNHYLLNYPNGHEISLEVSFTFIFKISSLPIYIQLSSIF